MISHGQLYAHWRVAANLVVGLEGVSEEIRSPLFFLGYAQQVVWGSICEENK
jgi:hypothetical protein